MKTVKPMTSVSFSNEDELKAGVIRHNNRAMQATKGKGGKCYSWESGIFGFYLVAEDCRVTKEGKVTNLIGPFDWGVEYPQLNTLR